MPEWIGVSAAATAHVAVTLVVGALALLRPRRSPASRAAWLLLLVAAPFVGALLYLLVGETRIGVVRRQREKRAWAAAAAPPGQGRGVLDALPPALAGVFRVGRAIDGFPALPGNRVAVAPDAAAAIDTMVAAIDAAQAHVHLCFYI
jgi:cardiolipin synthase